MADGMGSRIAGAFHEKRLDFGERLGGGHLKVAPAQGWEGMPEVRVVGKLRAAAWTPAKIRVFLTLVAAMDRARDADLLWDRACTAALDGGQAWVFDPGAVASRPFRDLQAVLRKAGISQRHIGDSSAWRTIAESLLDGERCAAVRAAVYDGTGDARDLLERGLHAEFQDAPCFPYLEGPKVGPMWVRMLVDPGGAAISRLETVPVAVDVQVRKITENLGVTETRGQDLEEVRDEIQDAWTADVARHPVPGPPALGGSCAALDPALWYFAKWGCTICERAKKRLPLAAEVCAACRWTPPAG